MAKARDLWLVITAMLVLCSAEASGVHLRGRIVRVGFPARGQDQYTLGTDHYRVGAWAPVLVELTNDDGDLFNGAIEMRQADRDGDEVVAHKDVVVRGQHRSFLYVPGGRYESHRFAVRVLDQRGNLAELRDDQDVRVTELAPPRYVAAVSNETRVILDISEPPLNQLAPLASDEQLQRPILIARSAPADLPDNVAGLDMADVIVWDAADPNDLDLPQRDALLEWTRRGGTLVLGVSRNWLAVSKSPLAEVLPARLPEVTVVPDTAGWPDETIVLLFGNLSAANAFDPPLSCCHVTSAALATDARSVVPVEPGQEDALLVTRRPCGRGAVVLVAAEMRELLGHAAQSEPFLRQVLSVRTYSRPEESSRAWGEVDLFGDYVEQLIAFRVIAELYFLFAFAFAVAYIALATIGSWTWLKRKSLVQHAWTAFALIALLASGVSLASVQLIRGIGQRVEEFSVVDGRAGSFEAVATCYFGLKSATHTQVDLFVPTDWLAPSASPEVAAALRPLGADPERFEGGSVYAASQRYEAMPVLGELRSVPMRATLKQFEAVWRGNTTGRLQASLRRLRAGSSELAPEGWIENDLGTDLDNSYLFVASRSFTESRPQRFNQIAVYEIGELGQGKRISVAAMLSAAPPEESRGPRAELDEMLSTAEPATRRPTILLSRIHTRWLDAFTRRYGRVAGEDKDIEIDPATFASAMLLLTTYDEMDPDAFERRGGTVRRSQGQRLDWTDRLDRQTALFVGFSRDPGPARLCVRKPGGDDEDWQPIEPSTARVMYRVAVPVAEP